MNYLQGQEDYSTQMLGTSKTKGPEFESSHRPISKNI